MQMRIGAGSRGYVAGDDNERDGDPIGIIRVILAVLPSASLRQGRRPCRVGQRSYDRSSSSPSDSSITPRDAVVGAASIVNQHAELFMALADEGGLRRGRLHLRHGRRGE